MLQATIDAIAVLTATWTTMGRDGTPPVVRSIVYRALARLEADARQMLTGPTD